MQEGACREQSEHRRLRFEDLPFARVPGQSKLFLQYLAEPKSLGKYYPSAISTIGDLAARKAEVLSGHRVDRQAMCEILMDQNARCGGGESAIENILKLKDADCVAVLTGQQAGLFTGPLYTIYKALSAVRIAEELNNHGVKAVPVFWIATEDHDYEEVSNAFAIGVDGKLAEARFDVPVSEQGKPVGMIDFDDSIKATISEWLGLLPRSAERPELGKLIQNIYSSASGFGLAFGTMLAKLFEGYGLVIFDPLGERVKQLSAPIVQTAIERSQEIVAALQARSAELIEDGLHAQVLVEQDHFPLFWIDDANKRQSIRKSGKGKFRIAGRKIDVGFEQLISAVENEPSRYSAGVMLRPVAQDYLFPTICYVGGSAEIAYFAQNSEVYRILERPVTPIFHRQSFTIVEPKHSRTLQKYGLKFEDVFRGFDTLLSEIVEGVIDPETSRIFADAEEKINAELNRLDQHLSRIDPTLADNLATRRRKIIYHIAALRTRFERARIEKDEIANRRLRGAYTSLYPNGGLQERTLNFAQFANLYGSQFIDWIYDSIDVDNTDHRILFLR